MTEDDFPPPADALEVARRQLQLLTDAIAHDLRAPLRAIEGFTARVATTAHERLDPGEREQLQRVRAAAARMDGLLEALGELSRATHAPLQPVEVDLSLLAEWILADLQAAQPERVVQVEVQPGLQVRGDERLLRLLFTQLLANAWKFSTGASPAHIAVSGTREAGGCRVLIRDNGIGFDPRYADKLFQPLQRLHGAEEGAGHGLGLAIAQRIAQRHGGGIGAASRPGDGALFTVELADASE